MQAQTNAVPKLIRVGDKFYLHHCSVKVENITQEEVYRCEGIAAVYLPMNGMKHFYILTEVTEVKPIDVIRVR
jgi:hypothetical protein